MEDKIRELEEKVLALETRQNNLEKEVAALNNRISEKGHVSRRSMNLEDLTEAKKRYQKTGLKRPGSQLRKADDMVKKVTTKSREMVAILRNSR